MRAAVVEAAGAVTVTEVPEPSYSEGQVRIDVRYVGLCGTDLELFEGTSKYLADERTSYPHRFGHEWVGTVDAVGCGVDGIPPGAVVTGSTMLCCHTCSACRAGHRNRCTRLAEVGLYGWTGAAADKLVLPAHAIAVIAAQGKPRSEHVLIEPLVTVIEATTLTQLSAADRVLIIGAGTMGSLAALVAAHHPVRVDLVEPGSVSHLYTRLFDRHYLSVTDIDRSYDVILECSGASGVFGEARRNLRPGGVCALVGVGGVEKVDIGELALAGHRIVGVRHGVDHYEAAIAMLDRFGPASANLIDQVIPLDDVANAFTRLAGTRVQPKVVIGVA